MKVYRVTAIKDITKTISGEQVELTKEEWFFTSKYKASRHEEILHLSNKWERKKKRSKYSTFYNSITEPETIHVQ